MSAEVSFLAADDHIGIENYFHLSSGALSFLQAVRKSRRQAVNSSCLGRALASASAKVCPVHSFS